MEALRKFYPRDPGGFRNVNACSSCSLTQPSGSCVGGRCMFGMFLDGHLKLEMPTGLGPDLGLFKIVMNDLREALFNYISPLAKDTELLLAWTNSMRPF